MQKKERLLIEILDKVPLDAESAALFYATTSDWKIEELKSLLAKISQLIIFFKKMISVNAFKKFIYKKNKKDLTQLLANAKSVIEKKEPFNTDMVLKIKQMTLDLMLLLDKLFDGEEEFNSDLTFNKLLFMDRIKKYTQFNIDDRYIDYCSNHASNIIVARKPGFSNLLIPAFVYLKTSDISERTLIYYRIYQQLQLYHAEGIMLPNAHEYLIYVNTCGKVYLKLDNYIIDSLKRFRKPGQVVDKNEQKKQSEYISKILICGKTLLMIK